MLRSIGKQSGESVESSDIYINPAPHAVSVNSLAEKITLWLSRVSRLRVQHCSLTTGNKI